MKSYEMESQNHPPVQVPSVNIPECLFWILTDRGLWITVHHCAKRKTIVIICVANLHSLPWNVTSKAHKIRTTWKRRWIFKRASGNRCLHDAGKTPGLFEKQRRAAAVAAAIPYQYIWEQSQITEKERILREEKIGLWFLDDICGEDITRDSHLQACLLGHHDRLHMWRSENNVLGRYTSSIEKGRVYKIPKLTGKRIHVWGLVASSLLLHNFQFCKLGDIRAIRRP